MDDRVVQGEARELRRQEGITIAEATWAQLAESSATFGVQMTYAS